MEKYGYTYLQGNIQILPSTVDNHSVEWVWNTDLDNEYFPLIVYYAKEKTTHFFMEYIKMQIYRMRRLIHEAQQIIILGVFPDWVNDSHIWNAIAQSGCEVIYFNKTKTDIDVFSSWANANNVNCKIVPMYFADGFSELCSML